MRVVQVYRHSISCLRRYFANSFEVRTQCNNTDICLVYTVILELASSLCGYHSKVTSLATCAHDNRVRQRCRRGSLRFTQGGKYGIRLSLGAQECDVYNNVISDSSRYGVFFYRGSDEAEVSTAKAFPLWSSQSSLALENRS